MKITSQEEFGLRCLLRLARAEIGHSMTIPEIAAAEGLSTPYVAKILAVLRQRGLIESARGRSGGYRLAAAPADVTLGSILVALGEPFFEEGYCQRHAGSESDGHCVHDGDCTIRGLWQTLQTWMRRTVDGVTLADLLQSEGHVSELLRTRLTETVLEPALPLIELTPLARERSLENSFIRQES
jgi:Rrf2 family protein